MNEQLFGLSPTAWIAILTVALTLATILQSIIYGLTLWTTQRVERAYVGMSHFPPGIMFGDEKSDGHEPWRRELSLRVKVFNAGNTPATITAILLQPHVAVEPLPKQPPYDESFVEDVNAFVVKGDHFVVSRRTLFNPTFSILQEEASKIRSIGNVDVSNRFPLRLVILGYVDYIDRFKVRRRAGYARMYDYLLDNLFTVEDDIEAEIGSRKRTINVRGRDIAAVSDRDIVNRFKRRNNLVFFAQPGYNYDRKREAGEGNDWEQPPS